MPLWKMAFYSDPLGSIGLTRIRGERAVVSELLELAAVVVPILAAWTLTGVKLENKLVSCSVTDAFSN